MNNLTAIDFSKNLLKYKTITPYSHKCNKNEEIIDYIISVIKPHGFLCNKLTFENVVNLYACTNFDFKENLCFVGHIDVVPEGDISLWKFDPFTPTIENETLYARGVVDMKCAIACFVMAALDSIKEGKLKQNISFMITGDEEGSSLNGAIKIIEWMNENNIKITNAITGEPTSRTSVCDVIKIGRRGSINYELTIKGVEGHVAYPHLANNPINIGVKIANDLINYKLDNGNEFFDKSNLEITSIDTGNKITNVIPQNIYLKFNIRFNNIHTKETLNEIITNICLKYTNDFDLQIISCSDSFLTNNEHLSFKLANIIEKITNKKPEINTEGGTSDARFVKNLCPIIELGLLNKTAHKINEHAKISDINILYQVYKEFIESF
jgi:succinyl-diaminopimelate desuccinylase